MAAQFFCGCQVIMKVDTYITILLQSYCLGVLNPFTPLKNINQKLSCAANLLMFPVLLHRKF